MVLNVETKREYGLFHSPESHERTSDKLVAPLKAYDAGQDEAAGNAPPG